MLAGCGEILRTITELSVNMACSGFCSSAVDGFVRGDSEFCSCLIDDDGGAGVLIVGWTMSLDVCIFSLTAAVCS
jgi:hypothetical protein